MLPDETKTDAFTEFVLQVEDKLRFALTAALGTEYGREAAAEALAYGWEHWDQLQEANNPGGYLYRVGINHGKKLRARGPVRLPEVPLEKLPWVETEGRIQRRHVPLAHIRRPWEHQPSLLRPRGGTVPIRVSPRTLGTSPLS